MNYSQKATQDDVELKILITFIKNKNMKFDYNLINSKKEEPTDIRYDNINYQITTGDNKQIERRRKITSKGSIYSDIRKISSNNFIETLLKDILNKKLLKSDKNTVLLVDIESTGFFTWEELENLLFTWIKNNINLCNVWKEIYLVYSDRNLLVYKN